MESKATIRKRIIKSVRRHGFRNFIRIAKLRVKHAIGVNPDFANYYKLPNSEVVLADKTEVKSVEASVLASESAMSELYREKQPAAIPYTNQPLFPDNV